MARKFIQARQHGGTQSSVRRIVIHATVSPCKKGGARSTANYFHTTSNDASAHYVVDPGEIVQCLSERTIGYHAPPNTGTIGIELCDPMKGSNSRWHDKNHEAMLKLAASLVKEIAHRWDVPLKKIGRAELRAGRHGICGHRDVSNTWHMTDHTDPGSGFPWKHFMDLVGGAVVSGDGSGDGSGGGSGDGSGDGVLRQGESGSAVRRLQHDLNTLGARPKLAEDGDYGPKTRAAVTAFQRRHRLTVDGIAGPQTLGAIKNALAHRSGSTPKKAPKTAPKTAAPAKNPQPGKAVRPAKSTPAARPATAEKGGAQTATLERPAPAAQPEKSAKSVVDGIFGPLTAEALQAVLNKHGAELIVDGIFGTLSKKALQKYLGVLPDGIVGPETVRALQRRLRATVDGLWGEQTTRALQTALNAGRLDRHWWQTVFSDWLMPLLARVTRG